MKQTIRLNEKELKNIVEGIINEIGDTPKGQYALGQLHARKVCRDPEFNSAIEGPSKEMYDNIAKRRGGDDFDENGKSKNPMFYDYANGYIDYMDNNPEELLAAQRRQELDEAVKRTIRKYLR